MCVCVPGRTRTCVYRRVVGSIWICRISYRSWSRVASNYFVIACMKNDDDNDNPYPLRDDEKQKKSEQKLKRHQMSKSRQRRRQPLPQSPPSPVPKQISEHQQLTHARLTLSSLRAKMRYTAHWKYTGLFNRFLSFAGHLSMLCGERALAIQYYSIVLFQIADGGERPIVSFCVCTDCMRTIERTSEVNNNKKESTVFFSLAYYFIASLLWVHMFCCLGFVTRAQPFTNQKHSVCAHVYQRAIDFSFAEFFYIYSSQFQFDFDFCFKCSCALFTSCAFIHFFLSLHVIVFCSVSPSTFKICLYKKFFSVQFEIVVQFRDTLHEQPNWCETCKSN